MTRTYTFEHTLVIRVEGSNQAEARRIAAKVEAETRKGLPTGATLNKLHILHKH